MRITPDNVGDIIRMDLQQGHILIESVTNDLVLYRRETGDRYSTFDHEIPGSVLRDDARIQEFHRNVTLGTALNHAEYRAVCGLLTGGLTHEQREDANLVLKTVKSMQKHLTSRIMERDRLDAGKNHPSLDALISRASGNAQTQKSQSAHTPDFLFGFER